MDRRSLQNVIIAVCCTLTAGCAEMQKFAKENPAISTLGCAVLGTVIAVGTGSKWAGGGVAGACALGVLAANQSRSAADDRAAYSQKEPTFYGLRPGDPERVKMRDWSSSPREVKRGGRVDVVSDYSLITPPDKQSVEVKETWILKKGTQKLLEINATPEQRTAGGWQAKGHFDVPKDAEPGTYVVEHKIQAGTSYEVKESVFDVS
ncbi:MAG: hypothetical protein ACREYF_07220 [Gammaproteobacteria bacterium]